MSSYRFGQLPTPEQEAERKICFDQFQRYMIEIIAFTFSTNIAELNAALGQSKVASPASILSPSEHQELLSLATTVHYLKNKCQRNEWNTTNKHDRELVWNFVYAPAYKLDIASDYALDMIASYAEHRCDPTLHRLNLVRRWDTSGWPFWKLHFFFGHSNSWPLESHANLIGRVSPNETVRWILGESQDAYQRRWGFRKMGEGSAGLFLPVRKGFNDLGSHLKDMKRNPWLQ